MRFPDAPSFLVLVLLGVAVGGPGCGFADRTAPRSAESAAVEAKAGDFADYWSEVLRLARQHAAHPDSFRTALDALPGSHLTDEEWQAWVAPYEAAPGSLADALEKAIATVAPAE